MQSVRSLTNFLIAVSRFLLVSGKVRADYTHRIDFETSNLGDTPTDDAVIAFNTAFTYQGLSITFEANEDDDSSGASSSAFEDSYVSSATASVYPYTVTEEASETTIGFGTASNPDQPAGGYEQQAGNFFMRSVAPMNIIWVANTGKQRVQPEA